MGLKMLPDELLLVLEEQWPCRSHQFNQLRALLSPSLPSPSTVILHGLHAAGKSCVLNSYLGSAGLQHAVVNCHECVTERHLLERTVAITSDALQEDAMNGDTFSDSAACESLSVLTARLERLLQGRRKFILVFDGIDRQLDAAPTLLPGLTRMSEFIPNLVVVLVLQSAPTHFLHHQAIPHVEFPPYTRNQSIHILSRNPAEIFLTPPAQLPDYDDEIHDEDKAWLWPRFCAAVWDSLGQNAARDLRSFGDVCHKLWRPFVAPIVKGDFGTRDFSRLVVAQRRLFQDENVLLDSIIAPDASFEPVKVKTQHELPYSAKWLLIAAYLASTNPTRFDALYFMKATERKRRKKGGGTARSAGRQSQQRKIPRHLLAPSTFTIDRLLAILHAILPDDLRTTIDVYTQIATLTSLRLLVRAAGIGSNDPLEPGSKWRVGPALSWEYVLGLARGLDFALIDYVAE